MAEIHQLITQSGIDEARRQAVTKLERQVVDAAYRVLSDDAERIGFTYSGFALTSLPHKPHDSGIWRREGHNVTMVLQSGVTEFWRRNWNSVRLLRPVHSALPTERGNSDWFT